MRRTLAPALVVSALLLATPALAGNGGFAPVEGVSPNADRINDAYNWVAIFTGAVFLLVQISLVWFIIRYRRRRRDRTVEGAQIHGNTNLELAWTLAPALILVAIGSYVFYKLPGIENVPSANAAGGRLDVQVDGYRYYWNYEYPNGVIAVDTLRAPLDQNVRLQIAAPDFEVIHSWWIPALGGKRDAIPGVTNELWFRARLPGTYRGQCAEFCGIQHARMETAVEVLPREEFDRWLEDEDRAQRNGTSDLGEQTYAGACAKCHGLEGEGDIGPTLRGNGLLGDPEAVEQVVRNGLGEMPPVGKDWGDRQMDALTEYLEEEVQGGS
ncbi:MAG: cytochrome c oxidase subunit II [Actinomycetota bacterium]|nr:cytochrome c oxidase subunit II [Actinomycetota bacterium]